jgi:predicted amidophosphoribosyltransferase
MKKKSKAPPKKKVVKPTKTKGKKSRDSTGKKVIVGEDEFCPTCMEWRPYDEATGKCKVCGRQIKKTGARSRQITEEYDLKDFTVEHDDQQDQGEY